MNTTLSRRHLSTLALLLLLGLVLAGLGAYGGRPQPVEARPAFAPAQQGTPGTPTVTTTATATAATGTPTPTGTLPTLTATATATWTPVPVTPTPTPTRGPCGPNNARDCLYLPIVNRQPPGFPDKPTLLASQPVGGDITLLWVAGRAKAYILYTSDQLYSSGDFVTLVEPQVAYQGIGNQLSLTLQAGAHYFQVMAVNDQGTAVSDIVTVTIEGISFSGRWPLLWADNRRGNWDIWKRQGDVLTNLTADSNADEIDPAWSWDGQAIAYATNKDGHFEIYRMNANGTADSRVRLTQTDNSVTNVGPSWSRDGQSLAITSDAGTFNNLDIYIISAFPATPQPVTDDTRLTWPNAPVVPSPTPEGPSPTPTPTSTPYIAATSTPAPTSSYYDNFFRQTTSRQPNFSPDGTQITFISNRSGHDEVYVMAATGYYQRQLTFSGGDNIWPRWSPDGARIAFTSFRDGNWELYTIRPDGSEEVRLTTNLAADTQPTWAGSNQYLVFITTRNGGRNDIYAISDDGRQVVPVQVDGFQHYAPAWSP